MSQKSLEDYSRNELIEIIESLQTQRKFGLVWEDKSEQVAEDCKIKLPVISEVSNRAVNSSPNEPVNFIIEGDNYHALSVLNYTHTGKIDAIYIDPPYNTGSTSWRYNNKIIDNNDRFKHSSWLSMMSKRLKLAKNLLRPNGIICVTIDDYEVPTLTLLMNQIFGEENKLGVVVIKNNPSGRSTTSGFSVTHEYGLFYAKTSVAKLGRLKRTEKQASRYSEHDEIGNFEWVNFRKHGGYREDCPKMYYPIWLNIAKNSIRIPNTDWDDNRRVHRILDIKADDEIEILPIDEQGRDRRWKWSIERARKEIAEMKISNDRTGNAAVYIKARMKDEGILPSTWWDKTEYSATSNGNNLLERILGGKFFDYPKSLYAVMDSIRVLSSNKNAIILDFFAGSGTTGQAVLELNKEDGGHRQFILCTNNENKIAEEVTYPRVKTVITGKREDGSKYSDGIPANLRYFKTTFIDKSSTLDKLRRELSPACEDMIRIREDAYEKIIDEDMFKVFKNKRGLTAIIYNRFELDGYIAKLEELETETPVHLYVFSYDKDGRADQIPKAAKHQYESQPIPEGVLEVYKRIFR